MSEPYAPPLDRLLTLGRPERGRDWLNYSAFGVGKEHLPELVRMACDESLLYGDEESPAVWARLHAMRALGQLGDPAAMPPLLDMLASFNDENWDDYFSEELAPVSAHVGPAALPALAGFLADVTMEEHARGYVGTAIREVGRRHPESRGECVGILTRQLEKAEENGEALNALLVSDLIGLKAVESAGVIESAFNRGLVDLTLTGDWSYVKYDLGLGPEPTHTRRFHPGSALLPQATNPRERAEARRKKAKAEKKRKKRGK